MEAYPNEHLYVVFLSWWRCKKDKRQHKHMASRADYGIAERIVDSAGIGLNGSNTPEDRGTWDDHRLQLVVQDDLSFDEPIIAVLVQEVVEDCVITIVPGRVGQVVAVVRCFCIGQCCLALSWRCLHACDMGHAGAFSSVCSNSVCFISSVGCVVVVGFGGVHAPRDVGSVHAKL